MASEVKHRVLGLGNPLLDLTATVDKPFLAKYQLKHAGYTFFESPTHEGIYEDMLKFNDAVQVPGGATQNSIRVCQALSGVPRATSYVGCVGASDPFAVEMEKLCAREGVNVKYCKSTMNDTGVCGVCVEEDKERTLCTRIGAANDFKLEFLQSEEIWNSMVVPSTIVYSAGFFMTACAAGQLLVAKHCAEEDKIFSTGLSAPFLIENYAADFLAIMPYVDYIFGNETEWACFGATHKQLLFPGDANPNTSDLEAVAHRVALLPKANTLRPRVVVVTQGCKETIVAEMWPQLPHGGPPTPPIAKLCKYPVIPLTPEEIVDTNAAGDAFVGGFLHGLAEDCPLDACVQLAHYAAAHCVGCVGATFNFSKDPKKPTV